MKNLKTTLALILLLITSVLSAQQQTSTTTPTPKVKEFGIGIVNLNSFSLQYRWGNEKLLYRVNGNIGANNFGSRTNSSSTDYTNNAYNNSNDGYNQQHTPINLNCGLSFSILNLKQINPKFGVMYGGIAGTTYSYSTNQTTVESGNQSAANGNTSSSTTTKTNSQTLQPYIGFVLGAYFKINPSFLIYAEISPNIFYADTQTKSTGTTSYYPQMGNSRSTENDTHSGNIGISGLSNSGAMLTFVYRITK